MILQRFLNRHHFGKDACAFLCALAAAMVALTSIALGQPYYHQGTTRKILQVTGDFDGCLRRPTKTLTFTNASVLSTDLGSTFEHKGRLYFLFGDTFGKPGFSGTPDCLGYTTSTDPSSFTLTFPLDTDGTFKRIDVPGIGEGGMCIPSGGVSYNDVMYIVQTTQWSDPNMERSVLASSTDDGMTWNNLFTLSQAATGHNMTNAHFINVSMSIANSADWPGLPHSGDNLLIFGTGAYRQSNVYLAAMRADDLSTKTSIRYFSGLNGTVPQWSQLEADAVPFFNQPEIGEFSCYYIPQLEKWVMLYNASWWTIQMRTADKPWGPWSANAIIVECGGKDNVFGTYMHLSWSDRHIDAFQDWDVPWANDSGGPYGPYLIPRWITGNTEKCQLYYTMSTWNPYDVVLMRTDVGSSATVIPDDDSTQTLTPGSLGWTKTVGDWHSTYIEERDGNRTWMKTGDRNDAKQGIMYTWLPRDPYNNRLEFKVSGGDEEVMLIQGGGEIPTSGDFTGIYNDIKAGVYGEVIECTWGHNDNSILVPVTWYLTPFDRSNLKVVIIDKDAATGWNFVGVSQMTLWRAKVPPEAEASPIWKQYD